MPRMTTQLILIGDNPARDDAGNQQKSEEQQKSPGSNHIAQGARLRHGVRITARARRVQ
jgi:hypothetical protein